MVIQRGKKQKYLFWNPHHFEHDQTALYFTSKTQLYSVKIINGNLDVVKIKY
jgi:hypothetical protein